MGKTKLTKELERSIYNAIYKQGVFCCLEVTIGWFGSERVDMLSYDTKGIFRCFEIKSSVSDFYSKAKKTFIGHYNYFVLTQEVYQKVKEDIPKEIGVYIGGDCIKRAKKQQVSKETMEVLKDSMIRSLSRYFEEKMANSDNNLIKKKDEEIKRLRSEKYALQHKYMDMYAKYCELRGQKYRKRSRG